VPKDQERSGLSSLPVVMFSSMINDEMAHKCLAVGASCCIGKPQIGQLVGKVRELCGAA
jgi:two-component system chemotaxis response regulator CheV